MKKVMLMIRDGWGYTAKSEGNAILNADTPFDDWLQSETAQVLVTCHGEKVGLPEGFQGSSEVGHLNMGAGRIVEQEVTRIFQAIQSQEIFNSQAMKKVEETLQAEGGALHFTGLLQNEGVHAHQEHLYQLYYNIRKRFPNTPIWIHPIADGRDTPPQSFAGFYKELIEKIGDEKNTRIGTVWGRYYGMDRSRNWQLIKVAVDAIVDRKGEVTDDFLSSVQKSYDHDQTPDGFPMFDEYLKPMVSKEYPGMKPGDILINFNYRQDRAIQISKTFCDTTCPIHEERFQEFHYFGLTRYYDEFTSYLMPPMDDSGDMDNILGEVISNAGLRQLRIAETQKFRHVTSFFNGKSTKPFPGEDQVEVKSEFDPSSFANHPEMNAKDVTDELRRRLDHGYDFIAVNYANCDMVGHTGEYEAAKRGAELVDKYAGIVAREAMEKGYTVIVTADHGNSEEMIDEKGEVKTSHTTNPVKLHLFSKDQVFSFKTDKAILSDIAPLILKLMGLEIPESMTSKSLQADLQII